MENMENMENRLIPGNRYTFYIKTYNDPIYLSVFRATVIRILENTSCIKAVYLNCIDREMATTTKYVFPISIITKVTNLETILQTSNGVKNQSTLPTDVLRIIDSYW